MTSVHRYTVLSKTLSGEADSAQNFLIIFVQKLRWKKIKQTNPQKNKEKPKENTARKERKKKKSAFVGILYQVGNTLQVKSTIKRVTGRTTTRKMGHGRSFPPSFLPVPQTLQCVKECQTISQSRPVAMLYR